VIPAPFANDVRYGRGLVGGEQGRLEWTGEVVRLELHTGAEVFSLRPEEITHVRDDERTNLVIRAGRTTYRVSFEVPAGEFLRATTTGAVFPGSGLQQMRDAALGSPANAWLELFRACGIRVHDNTFVPPPPLKLAAWTLGILVGVILLVCVVAFLVFLL
jgi:hypothetical protein